MKKDEVPQDCDPAFEGGKKLMIAVTEDGRFVGTPSSGWEVEATVKDLAWQAIHSDVDQTRAKVYQGLASPLEFYMKQRLMDSTLLAQNMGLSRWRVRWHLRPKVFAKLSGQWLERYADCLSIQVTKLTEFKD